MTDFEGIDSDWSSDFLSELIHAKGKTLLTYEWDSGGPGAGAGEESIIMFEGELFASLTDLGLSGPHDSLESIIDGAIQINEATMRFRIPRKRVAEIMALIHVDPDLDGFQFLVNDQVWEAHKGRARPAKRTKQSQQPLSRG